MNKNIQNIFHHLETFSLLEINKTRRLFNREQNLAKKNEKKPWKPKRLEKFVLILGFDWKWAKPSCFSMKTIETLTLLLFTVTRIVSWIEWMLIGQYRNILGKKEEEKERERERGERKNHYAWNGQKRDCSKTTWPFCVVTCRPRCVNIVVLSSSRAKATAIRYLKRI